MFAQVSGTIDPEVVAPDVDSLHIGIGRIKGGRMELPRDTGADLKVGFSHG